MAKNKTKDGILDFINDYEVITFREGADYVSIITSISPQFLSLKLIFRFPEKLLILRYIETLFFGGSDCRIYRQKIKRSSGF
jgi:hypothetical protein